MAQYTDNKMIVDTTNMGSTNMAGKVGGNMAAEKTAKQMAHRKMLWGKDMKSPIGPEDMHKMN